MKPGRTALTGFCVCFSLCVLLVLVKLRVELCELGRNNAHGELVNRRALTCESLNRVLYRLKTPPLIDEGFHQRPERGDMLLNEFILKLILFRAVKCPVGIITAGQVREIVDQKFQTRSRACVLRNCPSVPSTVPLHFSR